MPINPLKRLGKFISFILLRAVAFLSKMIPLGVSRTLSIALGRLAFYLAARDRRIALESLALAFPKQNTDWHQRIVKEFFTYLVGMPLETLFYLHHPHCLDLIDIQGKEYLDDALAKGKGVIGLTAHMGNFPLLHLKLARAGYPINVMTRPMRDRRIGDYFNGMRTRMNVKTIYSLPKREAVEKTLASLRSKELVVIQMDQDFGNQGLQVNFFGRPASTPVGPIIFALRTKSPLIPLLIVHESTGKKLIRIFPELVIEKSQNNDETVRQAAQKYNDWLESCIRQYPAQWGWNHRRWRSGSGLPTDIPAGKNPKGRRFSLF